MKKILFLVLVLVGMSACQQPIDQAEIIFTQSIAMSGGHPTITGHFLVKSGGPFQQIRIVAYAYNAVSSVDTNMQIIDGPWFTANSYAYSINFPALSALSDLSEYHIGISKN